MIVINSNLKLIPIQNTQSQLLKRLMKEVYPLAYSHFWQDNGNWYVNTQYAQDNILKELKEPNTDYYFVELKGEFIGNFRIVWDCKLPNHPLKKAVKLHRIYLHKNTQGQGVGKNLMQWLIKTSKEKQYQMLWLDAMDMKPQAFQFYNKLGFNYYSHCFLDFPLLKDTHRKMSQLTLDLR